MSAAAIGVAVPACRQPATAGCSDFGMTLADELDDRPQGAERAELIGLDRGQPGEPVLQRGQDLDALDRVDSEIGVELHVEIEHPGRVAGLLGDDVDQDGGRRIAGRRCTLRRCHRLQAGSARPRVPPQATGGLPLRLARSRVKRAAILLAEQVRRSSRRVLALSGADGRSAATAGVPAESSNARDNRCSWSSSLRKICWVFSCPSRNCRCNAAVCSASRWSADQVVLRIVQGQRQCGGLRRDDLVRRRRAAPAGRAAHARCRVRSCACEDACPLV